MGLWDLASMTKYQVLFDIIRHYSTLFHIYKSDVLSSNVSLDCIILLRTVFRPPGRSTKQKTIRHYPIYPIFSDIRYYLILSDSDGSPYEKTILERRGILGDPDRVRSPHESLLA